MKPLTPSRKHLLETYCKCLLRAERRIIIGGQIANKRMVDLSRYPRQRQLITHIAERIKRDGAVPHGQALLRLQYTRSKYTAELEGLQW